MVLFAFTYMISVVCVFYDIMSIILHYLTILDEVVSAVIDCIRGLGEKGAFAAEIMLSCGTNPGARNEVAVRALLAYRELTGEVLEKQVKCY